MSLQSRYQEFLRNPTTGVLAANATLAYVPTLTVIHEPTPILKHFAAQAKQLRKKGEKVLSCVESANGLCVEVATTLEFLSGGGAYLPALDDNFLADKLVMFPIVHIVSFDQSSNITAVRLHWDQGSLLKQIEIIGARARNWPIRDGKDQIRLIATSAESAGTPIPSAAPSRRSTQSGAQPDEVVITRRSHASSAASSTAMSDPRSTLSHLEENEEERSSFGGPIISPRASARPSSRNLAEILSGNENDPEGGSGSPLKQPNFGAAKGGAGKNYQPMRLFDEEPDHAKNMPPKDIKTDPKKYSHFEFGDGEMGPPPVPSTSGGKGKHGSQWDFADFTTPEKPSIKVRTQDARSFGWSDDEAEKSPVRKPVVHHPRPDSETHFDFIDDGVSAEHKGRNTQKGRQHNNGLGLYKDNVLGGDEDEDEAPTKKPLSTKAGPNAGQSVDLAHRGRDFGAHYEIADNSPVVQRTTKDIADGSAQPPPKKMDESRARVLKGMSASWGLYDESPEQASKKENAQPKVTEHKTDRPGRSGRKGTEAQWGHGGEEEGDSPEVSTRKLQSASAAAKQDNGSKSFWDF